MRSGRPPKTTAASASRGNGRLLCWVRRSRAITKVLQLTQLLLLLLELALLLVTLHHLLLRRQALLLLLLLLEGIRSNH